MKRVSWALLLLLAPGCNDGPVGTPAPLKKAPAATPGQTGPRPPGIHQLTLKTDAGPVDYTLVVPHGYDDQTPTPLVFALHYGGEVTPFYGRGMIEDLVAPGLSELEAILVAPDSVGGDWTTADNEQAVLGLFEALTATYNIDRSRTLLTGFSMGGKGVWHLGSRHQDLFQAAIPIAGSPMAGAGPPATDWKIPLYVIQSDQDTIMPLQVTRDHVASLQALGVDVHLEVVTGISHFQTHRFAGPLQRAVPWVRKAWQP